MDCVLWKLCHIRFVGLYVGALQAAAVRVDGHDIPCTNLAYHVSYLFSHPLVGWALSYLSNGCRMFSSVFCRSTQNGAWPRLVSQRRGRTMMEAGDTAVYSFQAKLHHRRERGFRLGKIALDCSVEDHHLRTGVETCIPSDPSKDLRAQTNVKSYRC